MSTHTNKKETGKKKNLSYEQESYYRRYSFNLLKGYRRTSCVLNAQYERDALQASNSILKQHPQSFRARLKTRSAATPPAALSLVSHFPFPYTDQQQIPIYLFLHHHRGSKLLCKWHGSLSLSCKYNVIGDVNNPFVCLTRSSPTLPVSLDSITAV